MQNYSLPIEIKKNTKTRNAASPSPELVCDGEYDCTDGWDELTTC